GGGGPARSGARPGRGGAPVPAGEARGPRPDAASDQTGKGPRIWVGARIEQSPSRLARAALRDRVPLLARPARDPDAAAAPSRRRVLGQIPVLRPRRLRRRPGP